MYAIWKFPLSIDPVVDIEMPYRAKLLHVAEQQGSYFVWALVHTGARKVTRRLHIFGTGMEVPEVFNENPDKYVGTFFMLGGQFVWHVFDGGQQ